MDRHILRVLETGFGALLFVIGLSVFMSMNSKVMIFHRKSEEAGEKYTQVQVFEGVTDEIAYSKEAIYMLLTDRTMQPQANIIGGVSYGSGPVDVYVDGNLFPPVSDYSDRESLKSALATLTASEYDISYGVDGAGTVDVIHFTGR